MPTIVLSEASWEVVLEYDMPVSEQVTETWDDIVDRLAVHDIRFLMGGRGRTLSPNDSPLVPLVLDLARAAEGRLHDALIALLLRHPEGTVTVEPAARSLAGDDPVRGLVLVSLVVAATLQQEWGFTLDIYLPNRVPIEADHVAVQFGLQSPKRDFGRPCLAAAAQLLRRDTPFPL